jgi:hypothetical protein
LEQAPVKYRAKGRNMSAAVFDTHAVVKRLKAAGFTEQQAEAHAETLAEALSGQLARKTDLTEVALKVEARKTRIAGDMTLLKWMLGFNLAFTAGILVKLLAS